MRHPGGSVRPSDLRQTLDALPALLDPEVGLIHAIDWYAGRHDEPQFWHCVARLADVGRFTGRPANTSTGGTARTQDLALARAIGESVERYCGDLYPRDAVVVASYSELGDRAIDPRRFVLFHPAQYHAPGFPFSRVDATSRLSWVQAYSLTRDEPMLVPATIVHVPFDGLTPADGFELGPVSGYAAANTLEEASLRGLYEVVERDAFSLFWRHWLPVPAIDLGSWRSPDVQQTLDRFSGVPARVQCASVTSDLGIPVVLAVMAGRQPGRPAAVVATAADLNPGRAIEHALLELAANHLTVRTYFEQGAAHRLRSAWDVADPEDHGLLYTSPRMLAWLDPVLRPRWAVRERDLGSSASDDVTSNLQTCIKRLAQQDLEVLVVDLTTPDVEEVGFKVVKVLVPGMLPIDFGVRCPHLGGRRLYEAPRRMGYRGTAAGPADLNLFPHPFP